MTSGSPCLSSDTVFPARRTIAAFSSAFFLFLYSGCTVPPSLITTRNVRDASIETARDSVNEHTRPSAVSNNENAMKNAVSRDTPLVNFSADSSAVSDDEFDFSRAFDFSENVADDPFLTDGEIDTLYFKSLNARVLLLKNRSSAEISVKGTIPLTDGKAVSRSVSGTVKISSRGAVASVTNGGREWGSVSLPCTLSTPEGTTLFKSGESLYSGALIIASDGKNTFSLINYLPVEEYLRGVVPLELGKRDPLYLEAVKAQAVAARTYTYTRIAGMENNIYDLQATVADQVYGGIGVADSVSDRAVRETAFLVLSYRKELVNAYYHSTCGGRTADVSDVWPNQDFPYLKSVSDFDPQGNAYCSASGSFRWSETWSAKNLSTIMAQNSRSAFPESRPFTGMLKSMSIRKTFSCGRVAECVIESSSGRFVFGGDKIRFLLKRNAPGYPILRSSLFVVDYAGQDKVTVSGFGYGHGVGMCQFGALGRAASGQSCAEILSAYYQGTRFSVIAVGE